LTRPIPNASTDIARSSFAIVANGFGDGPAQALRDYLVGHGARVVTILHPLNPEDGTRHLIADYADGSCKRERAVAVPLRPPRSFAVDPFVPLRVPRVDAWFGFNPLACARGLLHRRFRATRTVVLWSVDFVPDRFGTGTPQTRLYDAVDRFCCAHANARVELSAEARDARSLRHGLEGRAAHSLLVPMGAWLDRTPSVPVDAFARRRVVFLGHLVPRQGVAMLLDALALLRSRGEEVVAEVIGTGPDEATLRERSRALGLGDVVHFHGFVADHRGV
jgi:glycosyltransferase involved in cell wall biosynthesis